jgi:two-component system, OmpR family, response regulator
MDRVLLVEDELDQLEILYWVLLEHGCDVRTANTAKAAVSLGKRFRPTLLVTDFLLSHSATGLDVIRELREADPNLPALIITGMAEAELQRALGSTGNLGVLHKPFTQDELLDRLSSLTDAA